MDRLIELLAWAHHRFLWIHPFQDYNGRMGRLLVNMVLLNFDLPPVELRVETPARRRKYVSVLQSADAGDFRALEKLFSEAIQEAAKEI
ncbi:MAG: Fic family protein [Patescibacteria group bacterium]